MWRRRVGMFFGRGEKVDGLFTVVQIKGGIKSNQLTGTPKKKKLKGRHQNYLLNIPCK
jgi:hypothetical protein